MVNESAPLWFLLIHHIQIVGNTCILPDNLLFGDLLNDFVISKKDMSYSPIAIRHQKKKPDTNL